MLAYITRKNSKTSLGLYDQWLVEEIAVVLHVYDGVSNLLFLAHFSQNFSSFLVMDVPNTCPIVWKE